MNWLHGVHSALEPHGLAFAGYLTGSVLAVVGCALRDERHPVRVSISAVVIGNLVLAASILVTYGLSCLAMNVAWAGLDWLRASESIATCAVVIGIVLGVVRSIGAELEQARRDRIGGLG